MKRKIESKNKKRRKMIVQRSLEPWLRPLTPGLVQDTTGLISFMRANLDSKVIAGHSSMEVEKRLMKLLKWREPVQQIVPEMNQDSYVDVFDIPCQDFEICDAVVGNSAVKVFVLTEELSERSSEEKKEYADCQTGFVFQKCLRKVRSTHESRDIYTAVRCDFDLRLKQVLQIFHEDKFIIKRVAKSSNNSAFNEKLRREFKVQSLFTQLDHKGINKLASYHEDDRSIFAISFSAGDVDLLDALQLHVADYKQAFCEERVKQLFKSAIEGLLTAHNLGIAHRDVSMENLVVSDINEKKAHLEVIDWGHSVALKLGANEIDYVGVVGKERYFAPEVVLREGRGDKYDPFKADVFSLGVCLFSCLLGQMPFSKIGDKRSQILKKSATSLIDLLKKSNLSADARDLLNKCLMWNPEERISMEEVLHHAFFN